MKLSPDARFWEDSGNIFYTDSAAEREVLLQIGSDGRYHRFEREYGRRRWPEIPLPLTKTDMAYIHHFSRTGHA